MSMLEFKESPRAFAIVLYDADSRVIMNSEHGLASGASAFEYNPARHEYVVRFASVDVERSAIVDSFRLYAWGAGAAFHRVMSGRVIEGHAPVSASVPALWAWLKRGTDLSCRFRCVIAGSRLPIEITVSDLAVFDASSGRFTEPQWFAEPNAIEPVKRDPCGRPMRRIVLE